MLSKFYPFSPRVGTWARNVDHALYALLLTAAAYQLLGLLLSPYVASYSHDYWRREHWLSESKCWGLFSAACFWRCRYYLSELRGPTSNRGPEDFIQGYALGVRDTKASQQAES